MTRQSYDPYQLIDAVTELLRRNGLSPEIAKGNAGMALAGAGQLLRALGVAPLMNPIDAAQHSMKKVWSEDPPV
jgi:hypothetical protein